MIPLYSWDEKAYKYLIKESQNSVDKANEKKMKRLTLEGDIRRNAFTGNN
jgi:hypothetical protein